MSEIKPCPFCGCKCEVAERGGHAYKIVGDHDEECVFYDMLWGYYFESQTKVVEAWNRRANDA